jgi:hypothetical protein
VKCKIQAVTVARDIDSILLCGIRVDDPWFKPKTTYGVLLVILGEDQLEKTVVIVIEFNDLLSMSLRCEDLMKLLIRSLFYKPMCKICGRIRNILHGRVILTALVLTVLLSNPVEGKNASRRGVVRLAVIAPAEHEHEESLYRVLPAVELAVRKVSDHVTGYLPGWDIRVDHRDSQCSSTYGPLAAFEFYINKSAGIADS